MNEGEGGQYFNIDYTPQLEARFGSMRPRSDFSGALDWRNGFFKTSIFCGAWLGSCSMSINDTLGFGVAEASCIRPFNCHD